MILDGKKIADIHTQKIQAAIQEQGISPYLIIILIGDDPASQIYTRNKKKLCEKLGGKCEIIQKPQDISEEDCLYLIKKYNQDTDVHGILVQCPLPKHVDIQRVAKQIHPEKDVDSFCPENIARLYYGETTGILPATPKGILHLLESYDIQLKGAEVTIIGRSTIVGKPLQLLLGNMGATVTLCHSKTRDLAKHLHTSDIVISATGVSGLIKKEDIQQDTVLIDVGIFKDADGDLRGDIQTDQFRDTNPITPVPGGIGPLTMAMLAENLYIACCSQLGKTPFEK